MALRRINFPFCYTQGYNQREKFSHIDALPIGTESINEIIVLPIHKNNLIISRYSINKYLPMGIKVMKYWFITNIKKIFHQEVIPTFYMHLLK